MSENNNDLTGLRAAITDELPATTTYAGIARTDYPHPAPNTTEAAAVDHRQTAKKVMETLMPSLPSSSIPLGAQPGDPKVLAPESSGPTQPSRNEDTHDSLGNKKGTDAEPHVPGQIGPRGKDCPPEHLKEIDRRNLAAEHEKKLRQGMSSTDAVDSIGNEQHVYRHEPQGYDRSGARLPDKKTDEIIERAPKHVGPRGKHAPKDSFHG